MCLNKTLPVKLGISLLGMGLLAACGSEHSDHDHAHHTHQEDTASVTAEHSHDHEYHDSDSHADDMHAHHHHHGMHVHGQATADVVYEDGFLMLNIRSPLINFLGFERPPQTEDEHAAVTALFADLQSVENVLKIDGGLCVPEEIEIASPFVDTTVEHFDIEVGYFFDCKPIEAVEGIEVSVFDKYPGIETIHVMAVVPKGQLHIELNANEKYVPIQ